MVVTLTVLIPSYREGPLLHTCIQSALATGGRVVVFDGPIGHAPSGEAEDVLRYADDADYVQVGRWDTDADKRTALLREAQRHHYDTHSDQPLWIVWLDSDELLLWGEYLIDWLHRAEAETSVGGFLIRKVELDGSVASCHNIVVRGDMISKYVHSIMTVELTNGMLISLPNVPICAAGGVPVWLNEDRAIQVDDLARLRPPLHGEPHILHRNMLRDPSRGVERQSDAEARWYRENDPARTTVAAGAVGNRNDFADLRPLGNVDIINNKPLEGGE